MQPKSCNDMVRGFVHPLRRTLRSSALGMRALRFYHSLRGTYLSRLSDDQFAKAMYGKSVGGRLDLQTPSTFDEKQWWLKIHYRDTLMTVCTDKLAVRDYVASCGLEHILLPLIGSFKDPAEIPWSDLPHSFYLKTNNSSAANIRCDAIESFDKRRAARLLREYLKIDHYSLSREWNYRGIEPRILAEPIIDTGGESLVDYRFFCARGVCKGIFVDVDTADADGRHRADAKRNVYDPNFRLLGVTVSRPRITDQSIAAPSTLALMRKYAERLSAPFPFCRVDLYSPGDQIIFGEITFFHAGGCNRIDPPEYQEIFGEWIDLEGLPTRGGNIL